MNPAMPFVDMARIPRRLILQDQSYFHVTWKCHNNDFLLRDDTIKAKLYSLLSRYKQQYNIKIYGYCFMDNHPHLVGYCKSVTEFSHFFQVVNGLLARFINRLHRRKGQVVMDRIHSPQIQSERHMLHVLHYIDLNPVRAGVCKRARDYRWSSYRSHAEKLHDPLLDPLPPGLNVQPKQYADTNLLILLRGTERVPFYSRIFFIGTPAWILKRQRSVYSALLGSNAHSQSAGK